MKRIALLGMLLLLLAGCVDYTEELWLNKDGSGRVKMIVGVLTNYTNEEALNRYMDQPGIDLISKSVYRKKDFTYYKLDFKFKSLDAFNSLSDQITNADFLGKITVSRQKDGRIILKRRIALGSNPAEQDEIEQLLIAKSTADLKWRYKLHLPWKILKANADPYNIDNAEKTVYWEYETKYLWNQHQTMTVEMKQGFPRLPVALAGLAILLIVITLIWRSRHSKLAHKGRSTSEASEPAKE